MNHFIISQANPHAVMMASFSINKSVWSNRYMRVISGVLLYLKREIKEWIGNVIDLISGQRMAPTLDTSRGFGSTFFTQEYEGRDIDISLTPWINDRSLLSAFMHCIYNPTDDEFVSWMEAAERETWRYIPKIKSRLAVEMTLDKCVQMLRKQLMTERVEKLQARSTGKLNNRVPSFFTSASLVNMSGLAITETNNFVDEIELNSEDQANSLSKNIPHDVPSGWKGMGLRGNFSSGSLNKSGSGIFLDGDSEDENSTCSNNVVQQLQVPGELPISMSKIDNSPILKDSYVKTSSMAEFYYQKTSHKDEKKTSDKN